MAPKSGAAKRAARTAATEAASDADQATTNTHEKSKDASTQTEAPVAETLQDPDLAIARMELANSMADTLKLLADWKNYCYFMNSPQAQEACEAGYLALRNAHREIKLGRPW